MRIQVLGCSGGIGDGRHTTSFLVDDDILVDAGTGLTTLTRDQLRRIDHVFLSHAHLDHILCLPLLLDSVAGERAQPVTVHATPEVIDVLRQHCFNWRLWPDFAALPSVEAPFLAYRPLALGESARLGAREFVPVPANHVVPTVGYLMRGATGAFVFSGDTCVNPALRALIDATPDVRHVAVECSFPDAELELARASKHYCPSLLAEDFTGLRADVGLWITHLKPGGEARILEEIGHALGQPAQALTPGQILTL
jgi:cAMP phosphodiesterase